MQGNRPIIGLIFWGGLLAYAASVAASLWFAWKGKPRHLGAAYLLPLFALASITAGFAAGAFFFFGNKYRSG